MMNSFLYNLCPWCLGGVLHRAETNYVGTESIRMHFVDGWSIAQVLGEGAFGEVKLLINDDTKEAVAVKVVNTSSDPAAQQSVRKEIAMHKLQDHHNIIKYFGHRQEKPLDYIFLEYAAGGELFDRIEPDVGMDSNLARQYFLELISAVEYLHNNGVTHRDIKPENILLSADDHVKLSDFGMATLYRRKGAERLLDKRCGTLPYAAPEVLLPRPYRAEPADVWSCGITLVAMLAGELPWDQPSADNAEYEAWRDGSVAFSPWSKLDTLALFLLKKILAPLPKNRPGVCDISKMKWCRQSSLHKAGLERAGKRQNTGLISEDALLTGPSLTQPLPAFVQDMADTASDDHNFSFSQPVILDNLLLNSQLHATQTACAPIYQRLVKRMTRFWANISAEVAMNRVIGLVEDLGCTVKLQQPQLLSVSGTDRRNLNFIFKVNVLPMDGHILLDFRLSNGDGLEFKKLFLKVKNGMGDVVVRKTTCWIPERSTPLS